MNRDAHEGCRGCRSRHYENTCTIAQVFPEFVKNCPCKICLIKGMCQKECDEMIDYRLLFNPTNRKVKN